MVVQRRNRDYGDAKITSTTTALHLAESGKTGGRGSVNHHTQVSGEVVCVWFVWLNMALDL